MTGPSVLPDPLTLTAHQNSGYACALCGVRLYACRPLGTVHLMLAGEPYPIELWACRPSCPATAADPADA